MTNGSEGAVPTADDGEVGRALENAGPHDDLTKAAAKGTISAGEAGRAVEGGPSSSSESDGEVVIGQIPDAEDITVLHWTARCTSPEHDLLGYFDTEQEARDAKDAHLASQH